MEPNSPIPQVRDRRPKILGALPRNAQNIVVGAIALLMIVVIVFSGRSTPKTQVAAPALQPAVTDPNRQSIQAYRARIEEEAQKLDAEEADLARTKSTVAATALPAPQPTPVPMLSRPMAPTSTGFAGEREKREYQSLFASNIALTYRASLPPANEREGVTPLLKSQDSSVSTPAHPADTADQYRLFEGTIIETVLTNRLDASFSGPVDCMVTTNVYAPDATLLIPEGARVLGEVHKVDSLGQQRLAVTFHRLRFPNGSSISLDQYQGLDAVGETGLRDQINHHYLQIFGVSLAIGAFAGLTQMNTRYSLDESAAEAYQQGVSGSLSQTALHILDRYLNVLPTFTIREGYRVKVYLSHDLILPAYRQEKGELPL